MIPRRGAREAVSALAWSRPEWWTLLVAALAWTALAVHGAAHFGHEHHHSMSFTTEWLHWGLMVAAMMLPLVTTQTRATAFRSFRARRHRAVVGFLAGYLGVWMLAGLPVAWARGFRFAHDHAVASVAFVLAAAWGATELRRRAMVACHATVPLAPHGLRADTDCARAGAKVGAACVASCWLLMASCTLTGHALIAMVACAAIGTLEKRSFRYPTRTMVAAQIALAACYGALALRSGGSLG